MLLRSLQHNYEKRLEDGFWDRLKPGLAPPTPVLSCKRQRDLTVATHMGLQVAAKKRKEGEYVMSDIVEHHYHYLHGDQLRKLNYFAPCNLQRFLPSRNAS